MVFSASQLALLRRSRFGINQGSEARLLVDALSCPSAKHDKSGQGVFSDGFALEVDTREK